MCTIKLILPSVRSPEKLEVHRWNWSDKHSPLTIPAVKKKLKDLTGIKHELEFKIYICDANDSELRPIETCYTLQEAYMSAKQTTGTLRLYVMPCFPNKSKRLSAFFGYAWPQELPNLKSAVKSQQQEVPQMTTHLPCSLCERTEWGGDRYTCLFCPRVGLCSICFKTGYHLDHPFLITRDCSEYSRQVIQAARSATATVSWTSCLKRILFSKSSAPKLQSASSGSASTQHRWSYSDASTSSQSKNKNIADGIPPPVQVHQDDRTSSDRVRSQSTDRMPIEIYIPGAPTNNSSPEPNANGLRFLEVRLFQKEISHLREMGFNQDDIKLRQVLRLTQGDLANAIDQLDQM